MWGSDLFLNNGVPSADEYEVLEEIGHGSFSEVHSAKRKATGELVALKHMQLPQEGKRPLHVAREIEALMTLQGQPHILPLLDTVQGRFSICLVLGHCITDLCTLLLRQPGTPLPANVTKAIMQALLTALAACHAAGFAHRDVAPTNVLFEASGELRLSDFGQARRLPEEKEKGDSAARASAAANAEEHEAEAAQNNMSPAVGTRWYRAPELLFGSRGYDASVDIWSAGCLFAELLSGVPLFPGNSDIDQLCKFREVLGSVNETVWPSVAALPDWGKLLFPPQEAKPWAEALPGSSAAVLSLLGGMMRYDPATRLTAAQALQESYFSEEPAPASAAEVAAAVKGILAKPKPVPHRSPSPDFKDDFF